MLCSTCNLILRKYGHNSKGIQRYRCINCKKIYLPPQNKLLDNMTLNKKKAFGCLHSLLEGMSIRSTERITGVHRDTILSLISIAGHRCDSLLIDKIHKLKVTEVQADEIWCFVQMKERTKKIKGIVSDTIGSVYTFIALESYTKLVLAWHLGVRSDYDTEAFTNKIDYATNGHFQICTDGFTPYKTAIPKALGTRVDFGQLVKTFKTGYKSQSPTGERRYSASKVFKINKIYVVGNPTNISTSYIERFNLTLRMSIRRFTRLTNAFSKKWGNLYSALALYIAYYNFCRIHSSIKCTPAMAAGITDHAWTIEELLR